MMSIYYIASCLFTARFPNTSIKIQNYIQSKNNIEIIRCCIPKYRVRQNEDRIPDENVKIAWKNLKQCADLKSGDIVYSICPNCINIIEEQYEGVIVRSLWELIDSDADFRYPDYSGLKITIQDCWRTRERLQEQIAVRNILTKMNIEFVEAKSNHENTDFCGSTLYREQPKKNPQFAPKHYVEQAKGKFLPHTEEEQIAIMREYCQQFTTDMTDMVVCYCHYCLEGLLQGGANAQHLAHLLF